MTVKAQVNPVTSATTSPIQPIQRLALIGVGMIGGSFVWSLKQANVVKHVVGVDINVGELQAAVEMGVIDSKSSIDGLHDVDAIVIATPVGAMASVFAQLKEKPFIRSALITDVGSTKQSVIEAAQTGLGYLPDNFVPSHPIAGREHIGVRHAEDMMFYGHRAVVTPHENSHPQSVEQVCALWQACGANVDVMTAKTHDELLAATSHLPHVLAYGLMESLMTTAYEASVFDYAAGGFKSFTRTASSNPIMWRDVCLNNATEILSCLDNYQATLSTLRELIANGDAEGILAVFERAKAERDSHFGTE